MRQYSRLQLPRTLKSHPSFFYKNLEISVDEKIQYSISEDGVYNFLGVDVAVVIERANDNFWTYRVVLMNAADEQDVKDAKEIIKTNLVAEYPEAKILSLCYLPDPREFVYAYNVVCVDFAESIDVPDNGEPFDLCGITVQKIWHNNNNTSFEFEYATDDEAFAAMVAFLNSDNVVHAGRTCIARSIYSVGDVDCDQEITAFDYIMVKRHLSGTYSMNVSLQKRADVNGNGIVDAYDYVLLKRHVMGLYEIDFILEPHK